MVAPVFTGLDDNPTYNENGGRVVLDSDATISDADLPATFEGATLRLSRNGGASPDDNFSALADQLADGIAGVTEPDPNDPSNSLIFVPIGTYTMSGGVLTVTFDANATPDRVNALLQALTYSNGNDAPPPSVEIDYVFDNGDQATGSVTVSINDANDNPTVVGLTGSSTYHPGATPLVLAPAIAVADVDSATLSEATVAITEGFDADDVLSADPGSTGIVVSYDGTTGVLTLSGVATAGQYRQVLATVAYSSTDPNPGATGQRIIQWTVRDSAGLDNDPQSTGANTIVDIAPTVDLDQSGAGIDFTTAFSEGGSPVAIADNDALMTSLTPIRTITVVLTNAKPGDFLSVNAGSLGVTTDTSVPGRITLTISAAGLTSPTDATLRSITFGNTEDNVDLAARDITVVVTDENNSSIAAHATVAIAGAVDDPGVALDDTAATATDTVLTVAAAQGVLANDNDPDGLSVITASAATAQGGMIEFAADGSYVYTPAALFIGTDTVGYTAEDPFGSQVSATLSIAVGTAGTAGDDGYAAAPGNSGIDAGGGADTITFDFRLVDATIAWSGNRVIVDGPSSHTVLGGFERYVFTDGTVENDDGDPLVDDLFYYWRNPDVWAAHIDAETHFESIGWREGRDPSAFFSTSIYLSANPDVRASGVDPLTHFDQAGWQEGRIPSLAFDPGQYLAANPDVAAANIDPLAHFLQHGYQEGRQPFAPSALVAANGFDYVHYLGQNPDVAAARVDPLQHFLTVGWQEGRDPNALFDVSGYLAAYGDVAAAGVDPLGHYDQFGWREGRDPSAGFDTASYLAAYPDVAAAGVNPLTHYLQHGIHEGRTTFADGVWG